MTLRQTFCTISFLLLAVATVVSQQMEPRSYQIGTPELDTLWVDPANGNDGSLKGSPAQPLRTLREAWSRIPNAMPLTRGFAIMLLPGQYPEETLPTYWESRQGSAQHPVVISTAPGYPPVTLPNMNVYDCRYLYLMDIAITGGGGDVLHFEACDHLLLRGVKIIGTGNIRDYQGPQEGLKINQSHHIYLESCDISGATDNAVDFVGVQHGHIIDSKIHRANDWCIYLKGGSAYFRLESNEIYDGGTGGFTAGQGTGFQFMTQPWIHYEAYDLKVINNIIHNTEGAALGVQGGYNILMAYNTCYRVGSRSHLFEAVFGGRSCDGQPGDNGRGNCAEYLAAGGWGTTVVDDGNNYIRIPNRNVYLFNNIFYNPPGFQSQYQHFTIFGPFAGNPAESNAPNPALADDGLQIRGNVIWNGPPEHSLGLGDESGCQNSNPNCNQAQLLAQNSINTLKPDFIDPASLNFRLAAASAVRGVAAYPIPDFSGGDRPARPESPPGNFSNTVPRDATGAMRIGPQPPGAFGNTATSSTPEHRAATSLQFRARYGPDGFLLVDFAEAVTAPASIAISDAAGNRIAHRILEVGSRSATLPLANLPSGKIFCTVTMKSGTTTIPVLVIR
ncbi:MAG: right-handed parallel beta-helix repeat-containing protein [Armatimonadetes bacterium]|nr:right-handed parallel beta-helix repeat-containing protein [Armatimonadota bacterium]